MKIKISKNTSDRTANRLAKKIRIRKTVKGTAERPRLCVFRSGRHIYGQLIDDVAGKTIASASSLTIGSAMTGKVLSEEVGKAIAAEAIGKMVKTVVFDRNGYLFHGRVKAFADGARAGGLIF